MREWALRYITQLFIFLVAQIVLVDGRRVSLLIIIGCLDWRSLQTSVSNGAIRNDNLATSLVSPGLLTRQVVVSGGVRAGARLLMVLLAFLLVYTALYIDAQVLFTIIIDLDG